MSRILPVLLLLGLAAIPAHAQWTKTWVNQGGAIGEQAEIMFEHKTVPVPLTLTPNRPFFIRFGTSTPPQNFLTGGLLDQNSRGRVRVLIPNHAGLVGLTIYLQGWVAPSPQSPGWVKGTPCTWLVAPQSSARFVHVSPSRSIIEFGGEARVRLANGQALMCGGQTVGPAASSAWLFDPAKNTVSATGLMTTGRANHGMAALHNGDALVVGGNGFLGNLKTAELYDGRRGVFTSLGTIPSVFWNPLALPIRDPGTGKEYVLVAGGHDATGVSDKALLYDVGSRTFSTLPRMVRPRVNAAAVVLPGGIALITGGTPDHRTVHGDAELFLLSTRRFYAWGKMSQRREKHAAIALGATHVLLLGGVDGSKVTDTVEVFDGLGRRGWNMPFRLRLPREGFQAALLSGGRVLIAGGRSLDVPARVAEILTPTGSNPMRPVPSPAENLKVLALGLDEMLAYGASGYFRYRK